jgi:hypothetical protein
VSDEEPVDDPAGRVDVTDPEDVVEVDADEAAGELAPREVDRVFSLMEEAIVSDAIEGRQLERLLNVLEDALVGPRETNPETVTELVSVLENAILEPGDLERVDVDGILSVVEDAVAGTTTADEKHLREVFEVLEDAIEDPTGIDADDVQRFSSGLEGAIVDVTDPSRSGGIDALFPLFGLGGGDREAVDGDADEPDMFGIARVASGMTQRATGYSMESGVRTGTRMAYAVANAESPAELLTEARAITLDELQRVGVDIGDERADWLEEHEDELVSERPVTREGLLERGECLLTQSAEIGREESFHPAFASILEDLAPDEARILRLLATEGAQPVVDVRDRQFIPLQSTLVASKLTMMGSDAGCRHPGKTPMYLQNLQRLGLVEVTDEPVEDLKQYQVLEAQPHVEGAREDAKRPKSVYRSAHLTDFGVEFCRTCLPVEVLEVRPATRFRRESE